MKNIFIACIIFAHTTAKSQQTTPPNIDWSKSVLTIVTQEPDKCGRITDTSRDTPTPTPDINDLEEVMDNTKAYELGTGMVYKYKGKKYVITSEHVLYKARKIIGFDSNYSEYKLRLVGTDMFYDVAVLEFVCSDDEVRFKSISFGASETKNSEVRSIGYWKWNGEPSIQPGNIIDCVDLTDLHFTEMGYIKSDAQTAGGFSGGPLLNKKGKVIGMNTSINRINKTSYALKSEVLEKLVHNIIENDGSIIRAYCGLRFSQDEIYGAVKIDEIIDDSPAAKHHKKLKGKYIKSINDVSVYSIYDVLMRIEDIKAEDRITIGLENGNKISFITNRLDEKSLENITRHVLEKHYKDSNKRTKVEIDKGEIVVTHNRRKDIIKTAGIEEDRIYCLNKPEQLGILIRVFGLHGYIELGKDEAHLYIKKIKFSKDNDKRVLYY